MIRKSIKILFCCVFVMSMPEINAQNKHEIRAVWVTTNWGLDWPTSPANNQRSIRDQQEELIDILDSIQSLNMNTVLFQVRLRGDVIYPSAYEPWNYIMSGKSGRSPGYDPLAFAIDACHERGLECHAWIVCIPLGSDSQVKAHGKNSVVAKHKSICKKLNGEWYLDPGHPQTEEYLSTIIKEIVYNYSIDGIHLDYIRYPDRPAKFPDSDTFKKYASKGETRDEWRERNITRIVYRIYDEVKRIKPEVTVSSSPLGKHNDLPHFPSQGWSGMESVYQNAIQWMEDGKQDFIAPMLYFKEQAFFPFLFDWIKKKKDCRIVCGIGVYRMQADKGDWSLYDITRQISIGRELGTDGQSFFRLRNLLDNTKQVTDQLYTDFYVHPALLPPLNQDSANISSPVIEQISLSADSAIIVWNRVPGAKGYVVYGSNRYPVDTNDGDNILYIGFNDTVFISRKPCTAYAVSAFDAFRRESKPAQWNETEGGQSLIVNKNDRKLRLSEGKENYTEMILYKEGFIEVYRGKYSTETLLPKLPEGSYILALKPETGKIKRYILTIE